MRVFSLNIEKHHNFKLAYSSVCDFLKSPDSNFASIDAEIQLILSNHVDLPLLKPDMLTNKGIQELKCGLTNFKEFDIIVLLGKCVEKNFLHPQSIDAQTCNYKEF